MTKSLRTSWVVVPVKTHSQMRNNLSFRGSQYRPEPRWTRTPSKKTTRLTRTRRSKMKMKMAMRKRRTKRRRKSKRRTLTDRVRTAVKTKIR
jgi:hypothetical protein